MKVQDRFNKNRIGDLVCDGAYKYVNKFAVEICGGRVAEYDSLDAVAKEWKDYKLPEPIIKGEKERKAIRAWAEANGVGVVIYKDDNYRFYADDTEVGSMIEFEYMTGYIGLRNEQRYTIAELCGEEEK